MAGIFGFYDLKNQSDSITLLKSLHKSSDFGFNHPSNYKFNQENNSGIGFSLPFCDSSWPLQSRDGRFIFQKLGEIILPDGNLLDKNNFEHKFLNPLLRSPQSYLKSIEGNYIFVMSDAIKKELLLVNDPLGNFALYYYFNHDKIIFSCQMQGILKVLPDYEWNYQALNQYLGIGFPLNGASYYKNVYKIEPATMIKFSEKGLKKIRYYRPVFDEQENYEKEFDIINNSISGIIETHVADKTKIAAALTGGFDSRVTWSILNHKNLTGKVSAYTHGLKNSYDIEISQKIARKLSLSHLVQMFDRNLMHSLPKLWEKFTLINEGINPVSGAFVIAVWNYLREHVDSIIDSFGGGIYRRSKLKYAESRFSLQNDPVDQFYNSYTTPFISFPFIVMGLKENIRNDVISGFQSFYERMPPDSKAGNIIDIFHLHQTMALRYSDTANVQLNYVNVIHPFLSLRAFNAVQRIPLKIRRNQLIYKYIIHKNCNELEKFPLENMGFKIPYFGINYLRYIPMAYEMALQHLIKNTKISLFGSLSVKKFVTDLNQFFAVNLNNIKEILLRENKRFSDFTDRKKLEKYLNQNLYKESYNFMELDNLVTFKLYLDLFHN